MNEDLSKMALQNMERFEMFMNLIGLSERTSRNYVYDILRCSEIIKKDLVKKGLDTIYEITSQEEIRYIQQKLEENPEYIKQNVVNHNRLSASVVNYLKYVDFLYIFSKK